MGNPLSKHNKAMQSVASTASEVGKQIAPAVDAVKNAVPKLGTASESISTLASEATKIIPWIKGATTTGIVGSVISTATSVANVWEMSKIAKDSSDTKEKAEKLVEEGKTELAKTKKEVSMKTLKQSWELLQGLLKSLKCSYDRIIVVLPDPTEMMYFYGKSLDQREFADIVFTIFNSIRVPMESDVKSAVILFFSTREWIINEFDADLRGFSSDKKYHICGTTSENKNLITIQNLSLLLPEQAWDIKNCAEKLLANNINIQKVKCTQLFQFQQELKEIEENPSQHNDLIQELRENLAGYSQGNPNGTVEAYLKTLFPDSSIPTIEDYPHA